MVKDAAAAAAEQRLMQRKGGLSKRSGQIFRFPLYKKALNNNNAPVVLGDPLPLRPDPLEVPDQLGVVDLRLAGEEEVPPHRHVVRARGDHHQLVGGGGRLSLGQQVRGSRCNKKKEANVKCTPAVSRLL